MSDYDIFNQSKSNFSKANKTKKKCSLSYQIWQKNHNEKVLQNLLKPEIYFS